jgi:hypothetical protein
MHTVNEPRWQIFLDHHFVHVEFLSVDDRESKCSTSWTKPTELADGPVLRHSNLHDRISVFRACTETKLGWRARW